jgi:hypothetical protein
MKHHTPSAGGGRDLAWAALDQAVFHIPGLVKGFQFLEPANITRLRVQGATRRADHFMKSKQLGFSDVELIPCFRLVFEPCVVLLDQNAERQLVEACSCRL